jgi:SAM-dependent methyltransferase
MNNTSIKTVNASLKRLFLPGNSDDLRFKKHIDKLALDAMKAANMGYLKRQLSWFYVNFVIRSSLQNGKTLGEIEQRLRKIVSRTIDKDKIYLPALQERAQMILQKIGPYLLGNKVLDFGAGNGFLGEIISTNTKKSVTLVDVIDHNFSSLPIRIISQKGVIPFPDKSFNTTIIYLVLHHSDDPINTLKEIIRVTKDRIIIMEGYIDKAFNRESNIFFDWFYNRVLLQADINVPLNFYTTNNWRRIFKKNKLKVCCEEIVGIDEPKAPEYHVFYVLDIAHS